MVKQLSSTRFVEKPKDAEDLKRVMAAMEHAQEIDFTRANASPVVTRALVLAALAVLGRTGDESTIHAILYEPDTRQCFNFAKLNLFQCIAVAGPRYEDVFCLAEHGLKETANCRSNASTKASWKSRNWEAGRIASLSPPRSRSLQPS